jgi:hypothetical protein
VPTTSGVTWTRAEKPRERIDESFWMSMVNLLVAATAMMLVELRPRAHTARVAPVGVK